MTIQVTGTLTDPVGQPLANSVIRVTALETTVVVAAASSKITLPATGSYNFSLVEGKHQLEFLQKDEFHAIAYIEVTDTTTSPISIEDLIAEAGYCKVEAKTCEN
jgi:hypothetical protein